MNKITPDLRGKLGKQTVNKVEMTNLMTSAVKALRGAGQRQGGKVGGLTQARSHPATQVQMQSLTVVAAPSGQQRKSSELKEAMRSCHTPCRQRSQPQHHWRHPVTERTQHQDGDTPPCLAPLCIPADTPGGRL